MDQHMVCSALVWRTFIAGVLAVSLCSCGGAGSERSLSSEQSAATVANKERSLISIDASSGLQSDQGFAANPLSVSRGTTLTWINNDTRDRSITSIDGLWDSGRIKPGQQFSYTFNVAGTFDYICVFTQAMQGRIEVHSP